MDEDGPRRGDELRNLIWRRYGKSKPAKLQINRELERGIALFETEAAKALNANPVTTKILLRDDCAVVSAEEIEQQSSNSEISSAVPGNSVSACCISPLKLCVYKDL